MAEHEEPGGRAGATGEPSGTLGHAAVVGSAEQPTELDLLRGELAAAHAKLELLQAQLDQARYNTEVAVREREALVTTLNRMGFSRAKRAVHLARRLRARLRRAL